MDRIGLAVQHLRNLAGWNPMDCDGYCRYCPADLFKDEAHAADCEFAAAVKFLDELPQPDAPADAPI